MKNLLVILAMFILTIIVISSCQKEIINVDANTPEVVQEDLNVLGDIKAKVSEYSSLGVKYRHRTDNKLQVYKQKIDKLIDDRSKRFVNPDFAKKSGKAVIRVPADYPTLQLAVDNSMPGGKIFVSGTVAEPVDVIIDVPGLTIQGQGSSPTISGSTLTITEENITVQNININVAMVIYSTTNAKVINNTISATNNVGAEAPLSLINSSNNEIKNCTVDGAYEGGYYINGIYLDQLSNNNKVDNCISKNTDDPSSFLSAGFRIDGANNIIKKCTAINFTRGFLTGCVEEDEDGCLNRDNQFIDCVANGSTTDAGFVIESSEGINHTLKNCTANNNFGFGFFIFRGTIEVSGCVANSNGTGILSIFSNFKMEKNTFMNNSFIGAYIYDVEAGYHTGTLEKNTINSNGLIGIYLQGVNNSAIVKNKSNENPVCDFNQTLCSGNLVTGNHFGTSCFDL